MMTANETKELLESLLKGIHANQLNVLTGDNLKIVYQEVTNKEQEDAPHFPLNKTKDDGVRLYDFLTAGHYMNVPLDSWLFLMGFVTERPKKVVAIQWLTTMEQLRIMLRKSFEDLIEKKSVKLVDLRNLVPLCFVDDEGKPAKLPKAKQEFSPQMDRLEEFFRPSSDL